MRGRLKHLHSLCRSDTEPEAQWDYVAEIVECDGGERRIVYLDGNAAEKKVQALESLVDVLRGMVRYVREGQEDEENDESTDTKEASTSGDKISCKELIRVRDKDRVVD